MSDAPSIRRFSHRSARSGAVTAGFGLAIAIETAVLHLWLAGRHPAIAWSLTLVSLATFAWLAADWRAMGRAGISVTAHAVELRIGRRFAADVPRTSITGVVRPTWRDLPEPGSPAAAGFVDLTKPAEPNVLLTLASPVHVRLPGGLRRPVKRLALHVDDPDGFVAALGV